MTVGGRDRLVGRDEHEDLDADVAGHARHHPRGERVVAHRLDRVGSPSGRRACRRRRGRRRSGGARRTPPACAPPPCSRRAPRRCCSACRSSTSSRSISNRLSSAWSSRTSRLGPDARDLAAQLGADRAAGAGDQHAAAGQVAAGQLGLHPHRLAAEHVLHPHLAHLAHELGAVLEQLEDGRHRAHRDAAGAARADDARAQRAGRRGDGDQHLVGLDVVEHARELVAWCRAPRARGRPARAACARRRRRSRPGGSRGRGCAGSRAAAAGRRRRRRRSAPSARRAGRGSRAAAARRRGASRSARRR